MNKRFVVCRLDMVELDFPIFTCIPRQSNVSPREDLTIKLNDFEIYKITWQLNRWMVGWLRLERHLTCPLEPEEDIFALVTLNYLLHQNQYFTSLFVGNSIVSWERHEDTGQSYDVCGIGLDSIYLGIFPKIINLEADAPLIITPVRKFNFFDKFHGPMSSAFPFLILELLDDSGLMWLEDRDFVITPASSVAIHVNTKPRIISTSNPRIYLLSLSNDLSTERQCAKCVTRFIKNSEYLEKLESQRCFLSFSLWPKQPMIVTWLSKTRLHP